MAKMGLIVSTFCTATSAYVLAPIAADLTPQKLTPLLRWSPTIKMSDEHWMNEQQAMLERQYENVRSTLDSTRRLVESTRLQIEDVQAAVLRVAGKRKEKLHAHLARLEEELDKHVKLIVELEATQRELLRRRFFPHNYYAADM